MKTLISLFSFLMVLPQVSFAEECLNAPPNLGKSAQQIYSVIAANGAKSQWVELAKATYYANSFEGKLTKNETRFSNKKMLAAHNHRPLGSKVTIENPSTGEFACVTIADTGRLGRNHIDLSQAAFKAVGFNLAKGTGTVDIKNGWRADCPRSGQEARDTEQSPQKRSIASKTRRTADASH